MLYTLTETSIMKKPKIHTSKTIKKTNLIDVYYMLFQNKYPNAKMAATYGGFGGYVCKLNLVSHNKEVAFD